MSLYIYIGLGGILGAIGRGLICEWINQKWQGNFPLATFTVNIIGSFLLGLVVTGNNSPELADANINLGLSVGFLGAFTTFATFGFEILKTIKEFKITAVVYTFASLVLGLVAAFLGVAGGKYFCS